MCAQSLVRQDVSERPRSFCFWGREGQRQMNGGRQCSEMQPNDNNRAGSVHRCTQTACLHAGFPYTLSLRPIPQWAALEGCTAVALMAEHDDARQARPMTTIEQAVCTGVRNLRACTRFSLRPIPQWAALDGVR